ncbi:MAG: D-glycero-beta-D-manno-heptose-7-phosphate kinase [Bacteroidetes bacterium]|nr:D-glycero-beta-D-manno-heptose-7-phosphate kinase [Bacteroidota bacterium]
MTKSIAEIFESFSQHKVLVIGDVMIDSYLMGKVERISPEAPVPIISMIEQENRLGGAANVALNIQSLGAVPILCAVVGNDERAETFRELLTEKNITAEGIISDPDRITTVKTRIISGRQHLMRVDRETDKPLSLQTENNFIKHVEKLLNEHIISAIIFEDYDKGVITPEVITSVVSMAKEKNIPTLVDPKKRNFLQYNETTLFKPNFKELTEGLKIDLKKNDAKGLFDAALHLHKQGIRYVLVTLSEYGVFISDGNSYKLIPAEIRDISDVSGAGDTVISVASLCMASGMDTVITAQVANIAGGLVCEKVGVVPIDKTQLLNELKTRKLTNLFY